MVTCTGASSLCVTLGWILSPVTGAPTSCTWIPWRVSLAAYAVKDHFDIRAAPIPLLGKQLWLSVIFPVKRSTVCLGSKHC